MPSSHLILCCPLLLLPPIPPSIRVSSNESTLCKRWPKYWSFSFIISPSSEHPGLVSLPWVNPSTRVPSSSAPSGRSGPQGQVASALTPPLSSPKLEKRSVFLERSSGQYANSDEEDGYESPDVKRRGASVDEFLKGSELGKPVSSAHSPPTMVAPCGRGSGPCMPRVCEKDKGIQTFILWVTTITVSLESLD